MCLHQGAIQYTVFTQCRANSLTISFPKILAFATYGSIKVVTQYSYFNSYLHLMALKSILIFLEDPATLSKGSPLRMTVLTPLQQWEVNWNSYGLHTQRVKLMHFCQAFFFSPLKWKGSGSNKGISWKSNFFWTACAVSRHFAWSFFASEQADKVTVSFSSSRFYRTVFRRI